MNFAWWYIQVFISQFVDYNARTSNTNQNLTADQDNGDSTYGPHGTLKRMTADEEVATNPENTEVECLEEIGNNTSTDIAGALEKLPKGTETPNHKDSTDDDIFPNIGPTEPSRQFRTQLSSFSTIVSASTAAKKLKAKSHARQRASKE